MYIIYINLQEGKIAKIEKDSTVVEASGESENNLWLRIGSTWEDFYQRTEFLLVSEQSRTDVCYLPYT